jgi:hypothetical protein
MFWVAMRVLPVPALIAAGLLLTKPRPSLRQFFFYSPS